MTPQEAKIHLLLTRFSLSDLLEEAGITEEYVVELLIEQGELNLEDFYDG